MHRAAKIQEEFRLRMIEANYLDMRAGGARGLDQLPHRLWRPAGRRRKTVDHVQYVHERP
jgi:hypothetical protein